MKAKIKVFANAVLSLLMPFLWYWYIFEAGDQDVFFLIITIFVTQIISVVVGYKKETRFITLIGLVSTISMILYLSPIIGFTHGNKTMLHLWRISTVLFYLLYMTDALGTVGDIILKRKPWYSKTSKDKFGK